MANGDGKQYGVVLTEEQTYCGCPDAMYWGVVCKHAVALALYVIRNPQEGEHRPNLKLARVREGVYC